MAFFTCMCVYIHSKVLKYLIAGGGCGGKLIKWAGYINGACECSQGDPSKFQITYNFRGFVESNLQT